MTWRCVLLVIVVLTSPLGMARQAATDSQHPAIDSVLDALHARAADGDFEGYFELYHERAVFLGTDRDEYWTLQAFKDYARPHFAAGSGWVYRPTERFVHVAGDAAWFEERLQHDRYGETRGTGVLLKTEAGWRIVQYNLTLPIPNPLFRDFARQISEFYEDGDRNPPGD